MSYVFSRRRNTFPSFSLVLALFLMCGIAFAQNDQMSNHSMKGSMMSKDMMMDQKTNTFSGVKVNAGTVTLSHKNGQHILTLSDDFVPPQTPDPHWQVVDSKGNVYELQKLNIKGDKFNKSIVVPSYVPDIAKVQIWCAFAETLLGEASFKEPMMLNMK